MREVMLLIAVAILMVESRAIRTPDPPPPRVSQEEASVPSNTNARVDFDSEVKPILQSKCMPCHFNGGQMYDRLPFDRSETIRKLGTKLFTRIRKEDERRLLEEFLKQSP